MRFGHLLAVSRTGDMHRPACGVHDTLQVTLVGAHQHTPREQVARIETADGLKIDEALFGDVADEEADLVHVAQEHDLLRRLALALLHTMQRAHGIFADLVKKVLDLGLDQIAYTVLVTGHSGRFA